MDSIEASNDFTRMLHAIEGNLTLPDLARALADSRTSS